jgi:thiol-disulfide isomerase/thioredoxin
MSELNIPSTGVTFIKFSAEWCGPCKLLDKTFDAVKKENPSINT